MLATRRDIVDRLREPRRCTQFDSAGVMVAFDGYPSDLEREAATEIDALRAKVKAFEDWVSGIYCDFSGLVRGPDDDVHDWTWIDEHRPPPGLPVEMKT